jgi:NADPH:quinone reductase-like Zn-dependent oxidoreductase
MGNGTQTRAPRGAPPAHRAPPRAAARASILAAALSPRRLRPFAYMRAGILAASLATSAARAATRALSMDAATSAAPPLRGALARAGAVSIEDLPPLRAPGPGEVRLRVAWSAVNRADTLQRRGLYAAPPGATEVLGLEAAGVVEAAGAGVPAELQPGARAMALLSGGGNAGAVLVRADHAMRVPPGLTLRAAGGLPEAWLTAFQLLFLVAAGDAGAAAPAAAALGGGGGPCRAGATVVVHAAASGVGAAAVQLAVAAGARVVAVVGSPEKLAAVRALGAAEAVDHRADPGSFAARLRAAVGARGADLILDPVGASAAGANADILALDGVWVLFGSLGGLRLGADGAPGAADALLGALLRKRATLVASTLRNRDDAYKARLVARFAKEVLPRLASGALAALVHAEFSLDELAAAHALMESNATTGKILVRVDASIE